MKKLPLLLITAFLAACSTVTPLPESDANSLRPMNVGKWDFTKDLAKKRAELGVKP